MSDDAITPAESVRLCELERVIQKFKDSGIEAANALKEIQDSKLYVAHGTFDDYTETRWGWKRSRVYQLIEFATITQNLKMSTVVDTPKNEAQVRPLSKLPAEQQPAAWEKAQEIAKEEGKPVAARHVEAAVAEVMPKIDPEPEVEQTQEPDAVVVDGTKPAKTPKWIPDDAGRLWLIAKQDLNKILKTDKSRVRVLNDIIAYAQNRIEKGI